MSVFYRLFCGFVLLVNIGNVFGAGSHEGATEGSRQIVSASVFQFPVSIPEPATLLFLVLGCLPILALKKRGQK